MLEARFNGSIPFDDLVPLVEIVQKWVVEGAKSGGYDLECEVNGRSFRAAQSGKMSQWVNVLIQVRETGRTPDSRAHEEAWIAKARRMAAELHVAIPRISNAGMGTYLVGGFDYIPPNVDKSGRRLPAEA